MIMSELIKDYLEQHRLLRFRYLFLIVLTALTLIRIMGVTSMSFQVDSESLVVDPMLAILFQKDHELGVNEQSGYGLGSLHWTDENGKDIWYYSDILSNDPALESPYEYKTYQSQIGAQGFLFRMIAKLVRSAAAIPVSRWLCAAMFSVVIVWITVLIFRQYGFAFAASFWCVTAFSTWICNFAPNLYWVSFTWFVPVLLGLICLRSEKKRRWIYPLFFVALLIKCLCGFEYLSTIMVSAELFMAAEWITYKGKRSTLTRSILFSGICMLAGFAAVVVLMCFIYGNGDFVEGAGYFKHHLVERRTFGKADQFDAKYTESLNASIISVLDKYTKDVGTPLLIISGLDLIFIALDCILFKRDRKLDLSLLLISCAATFSWFVLAKSHSYIHTHMNFVMYYMGFAQIAVYCLLQTIINHTRIEFLQSDENAAPALNSKIRLKFIK